MPENIKISELIPDNRNYNKGNEFGGNLIKKSLKKHGAGRSILVDKNNRIIAGNKTIQGASANGMEDAIVVETTGKQIVVVKRTDIDLDSPEGREMALADNATAKANIEFAEDLLCEDFTFEELKEYGIEIKQGEAKEDDYTIPDEIKTDIVKGDLFELTVNGLTHRLACGDSTNADDVGKLLDSKEPYLMVTDPPYGVNYDPNWRSEHNAKVGFKAKTKQTGLVQNDDEADWVLAYALSPSKVAYVWHSGIHGDQVAKGLTDNKFKLRAQIIWNKIYGVFGRGDYHWQHEPCWYAVKEGCKGNWAGDRKQTTVWDIKGFNPNGANLQKEEAKTGHGTQKPIACMARPIANHDGDVYDPFGGSGTTLVAAAQLNRRCFIQELDEKYCQVIIDRFTKLYPETLIKRNGVEWSNKKEAVNG